MSSNRIIAVPGLPCSGTLNSFLGGGIDMRKTASVVDDDLYQERT